MTRIRLYAHPLSGQEQVFEAENVGEWLLSHYGPSARVGVQVFKGEPSAETEITSNVTAIARSDAPEYVVLESPGAEYIAVIQIIITIISLAVALTASRPTMPNNVNRTQQSPNNALGNRENQLRMMERVEDIYGTVKAIPSIMMPAYNKYLNHRKFEYGYYGVSRGYVTMADISDGESLVADIGGASAAVYWPFTSPNSGDAPVIQIGTPITDPVLTVARAIEVDGITLKALNQLQLPADALYTFAASADGDKITQDKKNPNFNALFEPGDEIEITMDPIAISKVAGASAEHAASRFVASGIGTGPGETLDPFFQFSVGDVLSVTCADDPGNNGTYTITGLTIAGTDRYMAVTPAPADGGIFSRTFALERDYSGTYDIDGVADGFILLTTNVFTNSVEGEATIAASGLDPVTEWTDWVTLRAPDRTEVWINIVAPNGLVKDDGGQSEVMVGYQFQYEKLNPTTLAPLGIVETASGILSGSVQEERADTLEHATSWTGPVRVRGRRASQHDYDFKGTVADEIKWQDLYSVTPVTQEHFGNKTTIHTITEATSRSTAVKTRQLNAIASRRLPTYNGSTFSGAFDAEGRHVSGTISPTSRLPDIIAAVAVDPKIGARDLATEVDMPQIYAVQQQLNGVHAEMGQFNYTFDSDNTSFEETVMTIANAGFCTAYRQNGKIRLKADIAQTASTALFTHRNKRPNSETVTRRFANDGDFDGVEFIYTDPDSEKSETITLPLDGNYSKLKKFEIPGIRSFAQAWLRANREYYKLRGQRINIETETTLDARALLPGSRIDIVDNTRFKTWDGEVIAQAGLVLTLSQPAELEAGGNYSIILMRRNGSIQSMAVAGVPGNPRQVIIAALPSEAIVTTQGVEGVRTIYSIAANDEVEAQAYLIGEIELSDSKYATVRGVNYSADYYQKDALAIPAKGGIIN